MSNRECVYVIRREPAEGGESPNRRVAEIMVEIRVFYPHLGQENEAFEVLEDSFIEAQAALLETGRVNKNKLEMTEAPLVKKEHGAQEYELVSIVWECTGCGALVSNTPQHDRMHSKTRSQM